MEEAFKIRFIRVLLSTLIFIVQFLVLMKFKCIDNCQEDIYFLTMLLIFLLVYILWFQIKLTKIDAQWFIIFLFVKKIYFVGLEVLPDFVEFPNKNTVALLYYIIQNYNDCIVLILQG